jgi:hypothetical protein
VGECENAMRVKLEAFREFKNNGIIANYHKYKEAELSLQSIYHRKKMASILFDTEFPDKTVKRVKAGL